MSQGQSIVKLDCRSFGRGRSWLLPKPDVRSPIGDDLKLFATTFIAGFVFVSLFLA